MKPLNELPRKRKIHYRAEKFAQEFIANDFNATEAAVRTYPNVKDRHVAKSIGAENLAKPIFREAIKDVMERKGFTDEFMHDILTRNATQSKNYAASNGAVELAAKLKGSFAPEKSVTLNLDIDLKNPQSLDNAIKEAEEELRQIANEQSRESRKAD